MAKYLLCLLTVFCLAGPSFSQKIKLANRLFSNENSRTVYIGMENRFVVQGEPIESIIEGEVASVSDTVVTIRPYSVGKLTLTFLTAGEKVPVEFDVKTIPPVKISIAGCVEGCAGKGLLSSESELKLADVTGTDGFFDQFQVISFLASLGDKTFEISGNRISTELLAKISETPESKLRIHSVKATSPRGYSISAGINQTISFF